MECCVTHKKPKKNSPFPDDCFTLRLRTENEKEARKLTQVSGNLDFSTVRRNNVLELSSNWRNFRTLASSLEDSGSSKFGEEIKNSIKNYINTFPFREPPLPGTAPYVMGILNVTPDSFSDGGEYLKAESACRRAKEMIREGADIIDIGGESTRPGAEPVPVEEELNRVIPVIKGISVQNDILISIDTRKSRVAKEALEYGADIINDVSAFEYDSKMKDIAREADIPVILMHMQGTPETMQDNPEYEDVILDILAFFKEKIRVARKSGIDENNIILDPGVGFGKKLSHNKKIIRELDSLRSLGHSLMIGLSRKSFIGDILDTPVDQRTEGTIVANTVALQKGASIIRVHDVVEGARSVRMMKGLMDI